MEPGSESPPETAPEASPEPPSPDHLLRTLEEMAEYFSVYVSAKLDKGRLSLKGFVWGIAGGVSAVVIVTGVLLTAVAFIFYGAALGLGEAMGGRMWLGFLSCGLFFLGAAVGLIRFQRARSRRRSLQTMIHKYERTLDEQKSKFGRDLEEAAALSPE